MKILQLIIILNSIIYSKAYNNMFWSICKAVFTTLITDFQYTPVKPITNISKTNVSLIIFKGSHIKSHNYIGISKIVQKIGAKRGLNIDIKIPNYPFIKIVDNNKTFVLGHSSGVYDFLTYHNVSKYNGLVQIGSVLNSNGKLPWKSQKLEKFPIPVLTLIGKKDGYLRHTYCLDEMYKQNEIEKYKTKPIIILKNITHLHISNTSSSNIAKMIGFNDLKSTINVKKAWIMLAIYIVDFIILNICNLPYDNSLKRMTNIQNETQKLLNIYLKFNNIEKLKKLLNILHIFLNNSIKNDIYFLNYYDFILSKPTDKIMYFYKEKKKFFSKMYFTPLWIKSKYKVYISAKKINKYLFDQISHKFQNNIKLKIVFKSDKICSTTLEWILTEINIEKKNDTIYIQSPIFITNNNSIIYKNFYYFKILSPAQIIELINIDLQDY
jgi:hypothetical protein